LRESQRISIGIAAREISGRGVRALQRLQTLIHLKAIARIGLKGGPRSRLPGRAVRPGSIAIGTGAAAVKVLEIASQPRIEIAGLPILLTCRIPPRRKAARERVSPLTVVGRQGINALTITRRQRITALPISASQRVIALLKAGIALRRSLLGCVITEEIKTSPWGNTPLIQASKCAMLLHARGADNIGGFLD
jgi:hypothetical protein